MGLGDLGRDLRRGRLVRSSLLLGLLDLALGGFELGAELALALLHRPLPLFDRLGHELGEVEEPAASLASEGFSR